MVRINSEHKDGQTEISNLRLSRSMEKLKKEYNVREARVTSRLSKEAVLNGDPPDSMLWGEE
jgi:predicted DNA binding CopG/RHH family protein